MLLVIGNSAAGCFATHRAELNSYGISAEYVTFRDLSFPAIAARLETSIRPKYDAVLIMGLECSVWRMARGKKFGSLLSLDVMEINKSFDLEDIALQMKELVAICQSVCPGIKVYLTVPPFLDIVSFNEQQIGTKLKSYKGPIPAQVIGPEAEELQRNIFWKINELNSPDYWWPDKLLINANEALQSIPVEWNKPNVKQPDGTIVSHFQLALEGKHERIDISDGLWDGIHPTQRFVSAFWEKFSHLFFPNENEHPTISNVRKCTPNESFRKKPRYAITTVNNLIHALPKEHKHVRELPSTSSFLTPVHSSTQPHLISSTPLKNSHVSSTSLNNSQNKVESESGGFNFDDYVDKNQQPFELCVPQGLPPIKTSLKQKHSGGRNATKGLVKAATASNTVHANIVKNSTKDQVEETTFTSTIYANKTKISTKEREAPIISTFHTYKSQNLTKDQVEEETSTITNAHNNKTKIILPHHIACMSKAVNELFRSYCDLGAQFKWDLQPQQIHSIMAKSLNSIREKIKTNRNHSNSGEGEQGKLSSIGGSKDGINNRAAK